MQKFIIIALFVATFGALVYMFMSDNAPNSSEHCVSLCTGRGFGSAYCQSRCSPETYVPDSSHPEPALSDPRCMDNCQHSKKDDGYCRKACTYY